MLARIDTFAWAEHQGLFNCYKNCHLHCLQKTELVFKLHSWHTGIPVSFTLFSHSHHYSVFSILEFELAYLLPFFSLLIMSYANVKNQSQCKNDDHIIGRPYFIIVNNVDFGADGTVFKACTHCFGSTTIIMGCDKD